LGASGHEVLTAFIIGVEVACALGEMCDEGHYETGFHATGTMGTFRVTAAAARLMGLHKPEFSVRAQCRMFRVHPSGFYVWLKNPSSKRAKEDGRQTELIEAAIYCSYTSSARHQWPSQTNVLWAASKNL